MSGRGHRSAPVPALSRPFLRDAGGGGDAGDLPGRITSVAPLPPPIVDATFFDVDGAPIMTTRTGVAPRRYSRGPSQHATADRPGGIALQLLCAAPTQVIDMPAHSPLGIAPSALQQDSCRLQRTRQAAVPELRRRYSHPSGCKRRAAPTSAIRCRWTSAPSIAFRRLALRVDAQSDSTSVGPVWPRYILLTTDSSQRRLPEWRSRVGISGGRTRHRSRLPSRRGE